MQPRSIQRGNAAAKKNADGNRNYARKDALIGVYDSLIYITVYAYEYEIIIVQLREGAVHTEINDIDSNQEVSIQHIITTTSTHCNNARARDPGVLGEHFTGLE